VKGKLGVTFLQQSLYYCF